MDLYLSAILQGLAYVAMGLGIFVTLKVFNIPDITTDGSFTLGGSITAVMLTGGFHPLTALLCALAGGALAGMTTGWIHTRLKVNPLLAGILVMTALYSVNLSIMGRSNISLNDISTFLSPVSNGRGYMMIAAAASVTILLSWLLKTDFGIAMRATGNSEIMVTSVGINSSYMKVTGLALANALTAFSGYLMVQYQGFSDISMGIGIVISGLAAVMLGDAFHRILPRAGIALALLFVVMGSILFRVLLAFSLDLGLNPNYLKLITACMVLTVLGITRIRKNRS